MNYVIIKMMIEQKRETDPYQKPPPKYKKQNVQRRGPQKRKEALNVYVHPD